MDFDSLYTILIEDREIASYSELKNNTESVAKKIIDYITNNSLEENDRIHISLGNLDLVYDVSNKNFKYQIRSKYRNKLLHSTKNDSYPFSYDYFNSSFSNLPKQFSINRLQYYINKFLEMDTYLSKHIGPLIYTGPIVDDGDEDESEELVPRFLRNLKKNKRNFQQLSSWVKSKIK